ncbi:gamma-tubulin complex component 5-like [Thrips palmi]|uniref:Gamma-tubulin complex component n=1 Tax=Thrips palmi TaxID=161013 RepID=A0A6P8Z916_THRPL|nr:gamma-tubulin complex component 5-like [Thrips palmi]
MALKLKDIILEDVRALIRNLTGFEENDDNFKASERFILSNLLHHRFLSVDANAVRRSIEGMVLKFQVHGLSDRGQQLHSLVNQFLQSCHFKGHETVDIQWSLLSLLLLLGENPTNILLKDESILECSAISEAEEAFDWGAYLREGEEEFHQDWNDSPSDEDEVDRMIPATEESKLHCLPSTSKHTLHGTPASALSHECKDSLTVKPSPSVKPHIMLNGPSILNAESWLKANLQNSWWSKAHVKEKPESNHNYSNSAFLYDFSQDKSIETSTLSEHKVILECMWLLSAPQDTAVFVRVISEDGLRSNFCVRPHVTIPSLTQDVFASLMSSICSHADMIEELQNFCSEVQRQKQVCGTYKAYGHALQSELQHFLDAISKIESQEHIQNRTITLLTLLKELEPWMVTISSLYKVHKSAVLDWKKNPNWLCATHLLSHVLMSLRFAENVTIFFRIFVQTFQVYIKIIDLWLTSGHLYDTYDEFFIFKRDKTCLSFQTSFEMRDWEKELAALGLAEPPQALKVLAHCLLEAAQPLLVLCELNRLPELSKHTSRRDSLEHQFLQTLLHDLSPSQLLKTNKDENLMESTSAWWNKLDDLLISTEGLSETKQETPHPTPYENTAVDVKAVMSQLQRIPEPGFMKDFQAMFKNIPGIKLCDSKPEKFEDDSLKKLLLISHSIVENLPLEFCVERAVLCLSADWNSIAGALVANILVQEHQLPYHMNTAHNVFLLQASYKLQPFLSQLFKLILNREVINSHTLSILLQDCMDSDHFILSTTSEDKNYSDLNSLEIIDLVEIKYQVDWPLCAILKSESQKAYNLIFKLLLKMRWGLWNLEKLDVADFNDTGNSPVLKRMYHLRYWLLNIIRGTYNFLAGYVFNGLWMKFEEDLKHAKDMHSIIKVHERFLENALLKGINASNPDPIKNSLFQLVVLAEKLHAMWRCGLSKVSMSKLKNMETCYVHCHRFLASSLHSLAEEEWLQHLSALSDLFNWKLPQEVL